MNKFNRFAINQFRDAKNRHQIKQSLCNHFANPQVNRYLDKNFDKHLDYFAKLSEKEFLYTDELTLQFKDEQNPQQTVGCLNIKFFNYMVKLISEDLLNEKKCRDYQNAELWGETDGLNATHQTIISSLPRSVVCSKDTRPVDNPFMHFGGYIPNRRVDDGEVSGEYVMGELRPNGSAGNCGQTPRNSSSKKTPTGYQAGNACPVWQSYANQVPDDSIDALKFKRIDYNKHPYSDDMNSDWGGARTYKDCVYGAVAKSADIELNKWWYNRRGNTIRDDPVGEINRDRTGPATPAHNNINNYTSGYNSNTIGYDAKSNSNVVAESGQYSNNYYGPEWSDTSVSMSGSRGNCGKSKVHVGVLPSVSSGYREGFKASKKNGRSNSGRNQTSTNGCKEARYPNNYMPIEGKRYTNQNEFPYGNASAWRNGVYCASEANSNQTKPNTSPNYGANYDSVYNASDIYSNIYGVSKCNTKQTVYSDTFTDCDCEVISDGKIRNNRQVANSGQDTGGNSHCSYALAGNKWGPQFEYQGVPDQLENGDYCNRFTGEAPSNYYDPVEQLLNTPYIQTLNDQYGCDSGRNANETFRVVRSAYERGKYGPAMVSAERAQNNVKLWTDGAGFVDQDNQKAMEKLMNRRIFRSFNLGRKMKNGVCVPSTEYGTKHGDLASEQIPWFERALYNRYYERDVEESLGGFELDGLNRGYGKDMGSLYCRLPGHKYNCSKKEEQRKLPSGYNQRTNAPQWEYLYKYY